MNDIKKPIQELTQEQVWNEIAKSWDENRKEVFSDVKPFLEQLAREKKGKILDVGCGNCRNLLFFKNFDCYGIDFSAGQLREAKKFCKENKMRVKLRKTQATKLPFKDKSFDYVLFIAVLQCLKKGRERAVREIYRVLKKKGKGLITVWNRYKEFKGKREQYIPWNKTDKTYFRYAYFFTPRELEYLLKKYFRILKKKVEKHPKEKHINNNIIFLVEKS